MRIFRQFHACAGQGTVAWKRAPRRAPWQVQSECGQTLLPGCAHHVADPLPGLFIHGPRDPVFPREPVGFDLLEHHSPQSGKHCRSNHGQQHGSRFRSHSAILVTPLAQLQIPRRTARRCSSNPGFRPPPVTGICRIQAGALRPVEWSGKLAERPSTRFNKVYQHLGTA